MSREYRSKHDRAALVSSVRVETLGGHAHIGVWNRGGKAGTLVVNAADAEKFLERLLPLNERAEQPSVSGASTP